MKLKSPQPRSRPAQINQVEVETSLVRSCRFGILFLLVLCLSGCSSSCKQVIERRDIRPLVMRDVPAQRLAYRLDADTGLPPDAKVEDSSEKAAPIPPPFKPTPQDH